MNQSKKGALSKIMDVERNRVLIVPLDHGASEGPIKGLANMHDTIGKMKAGGADAIVIHKGIYKNNQEAIGNLPVLVHLSVSTNDGIPLKKVVVATPAEIQDLGATGVSIHVNVGNKYDPEMIKDLGEISRECERLGLPLLAMMYPRDEVNGEIVTYTDPERVSHVARLAYELGVDIVKVPYTGSADTFKQVVDGCSIPVVIAGGAKGSEEAMLDSIKGVIKVGGAGVSVGRNIFQHADPITMLKKVKEIITS